MYSPANRPDLIRIVPIFEFQNLKNRDIRIFKGTKRIIFFCKDLELGC